jgi:phosphate transport system protein
VSRFLDSLSLVGDDELLRVERALATMAKAVRRAMQQAGAALLASDQALARMVTIRDAEIGTLHRVVEDRVYELAAKRRPAADEMPVVFTAFQVAADLRRMGELAVHVARAVLRRHPVPALAPRSRRRWPTTTPPWRPASTATTTPWTTCTASSSG